MLGPNKDQIFPLPGYNRLCFLKNIIKNPNIIVGDYTYYDDFENLEKANFKLSRDFDVGISKSCFFRQSEGDANHLPSLS